MTVVDITGVHSLRAGMCNCHQAEMDTFQFLSMGLYPASVIRPRTCFTFRVLDDFLLANKVSGIAAQSYFERLRRLSNSAFPHRVPVSESLSPPKKRLTHPSLRTAIVSFCAPVDNGGISSIASGTVMAMGVKILDLEVSL